MRRAGCRPHSSASAWSVFNGAESEEGKTTNSKGPNTELWGMPGREVERLSWTHYRQREED